MHWVNRKRLPKQDTQVLTCSPIYKEGDPMRYRIMNARYVRISTDVSYWAYIESPEEEKQ